MDGNKETWLSIAGPLQRLLPSLDCDPRNIVQWHGFPFPIGCPKGAAAERHLRDGFR
jgi:hypothetical protein